MSGAFPPASSTIIRTDDPLTAAAAAAAAQASATAAAADRAAVATDRTAVAADRAAVATDRTAVAADRAAAQTSATNAANSATAAAAAVTPVNLLNAIKTVDGAGSGLDAEFLSGVALSGIVRTNRAVTPGVGLAGGGSLDADRELRFDTAWGDERYVRFTPLGRNRVINPAMQISQERGTTQVDVTTGRAYSVDQWAVELSTTPGGTLRAQQVALRTPGGSPFRLRHTVQVADASLAPGDYYAAQTLIEGANIADNLWGQANARQMVLRFGCRSSVAGTFGVSVRNSALNRSWIGAFTIAPADVGVDVVRTLSIGADTAGTWLTDNGLGAIVSITLACGTSFIGNAGWQAGNFLGAVGQTNLMSTLSATFDLFDVGLYVDPGNTSTAPAFEVPNFDDEQRRCRRYWLQSRHYHATYSVTGGDGSAAQYEPMRTVPSIVGSLITHQTNNAGGWPQANVNGNGSWFISLNPTSSGIFVVGGMQVNLSARF